MERTELRLPVRADSDTYGLGARMCVILALIGLAAPLMALARSNA